MDGESQRSAHYYRIKAEIMRQQAERATGEHLRALYYRIAENWEAAADEGMAPEDGG